MDAEHLADLRSKEEHYWWHVNKRRIVLTLLNEHAGSARGRLLEIGSGGGFLSGLLAGRGWQVVSSDVSFEAARFARQRGVSRAMLFDAGRRWPFASGSFQAVCMLDVLEHLDDHRLAVTELRRVLAPGGAAVITVPAHPFLYSGWDRMLGHFRRYTHRHLRQLVGECGLSVAKLSYWNALSLPPAVLLRHRRRHLDGRGVPKEFPEVPGWMNALLRAYGAVESGLIRLGRIPAGLSLVSVATRSAG